MIILSIGKIYSFFLLVKILYFKRCVDLPEGVRVYEYMLIKKQFIKLRTTIVCLIIRFLFLSTKYNWMSINTIFT